MGGETGFGGHLVPQTTITIVSIVLGGLFSLFQGRFYCFRLLS